MASFECVDDEEEEDGGGTLAAGVGAGDGPLAAGALPEEEEELRVWPAPWNAPFALELEAEADVPAGLIVPD